MCRQRATRQNGKQIPMYVNRSQPPSALRKLRGVELRALIDQSGGHINMMIMCLAHSVNSQQFFIYTISTFLWGNI